MMEPTNSLLLDLKEMADFNAEDDIELRPTGFTRTSISTSLNQTHLFICSKRVLTLLHALPHQLHSFRNDIAPFLAKSQWQKGLLDKYKLPHPEDHPQQLAKSHASLSYPLTLSHTTATPPTSNHSVPQTPALAAAHTMAAFPTTESGATSRTTYKKDQSVVYGIWRRADGPCLRANTVESYAELNRVVGVFFFSLAVL